MFKSKLKKWLGNGLTVLLLVIGLVLWISLPWIGVLAVAVLVALWLLLSSPWVALYRSLPADAERIALAIRSHWEVENRLHWCLDVQFGDDYARGRIGHIAHNLALVRHMALNLIRLDKSIKTSIKTKRLLAATSDEFRAALLGFEPPDEDDDD